MSDLQFKSSPQFSLGMEIELQLLDPETLQLVDGILPLLELKPQNPFIQAEFNQATVEINSPVCLNIPELEIHILEIIRDLKSRCQKLGLEICAAGTHPYCDRIANITPISRYLNQQSTFGYLADLMMTFALQIHVGMPSGDEAIKMMSRLKPYLPILLALSASSPFWWGKNTGFASFRYRFLSIMRSYCICPKFKNWAEFSQFFTTAKNAGMLKTIHDIHWDIRPQPDLGTIEIRIMDAQPTIQESMMLAALIHTLIIHLYHHPVGKKTDFILKPLPWLIEKENLFRASWHGIEAYYIEDSQGNSRPIKNIVEDIINTLTATAKYLGNQPYLEQLEKRLKTGASHIRQTQIFQNTNSLKAVIQSLVKELEAELINTEINPKNPPNLISL
ncbi:MAG: YbdK family carboxylate-amine ligase [Nostocales cyanobacterium]|nr:MAG: YbdK family carboxylate-amine ligase [Nostocales cyanobacterium]